VCIFCWLLSLVVSSSTVSCLQTLFQCDLISCVKWDITLYSLTYCLEKLGIWCSLESGQPLCVHWCVLTVILSCINNVHCKSSCHCDLVQHYTIIVALVAALLLHSHFDFTLSDGTDWWMTWVAVTVSSASTDIKLENVAITNVLQLEAARHCAVPTCFNFVARAKFELAQPIHCRLGAFLLLICYVTLWPWTLTLWPWSLTLNMYSRPTSPRPNSVLNLSEIKQSAAQLLRFEYLTLWPWTCIVCCAGGDALG